VAVAEQDDVPPALRGQAYAALAQLLNSAGRQSEALPYAEKALDVWRATLAKDDPDLAVALNNLGNAVQPGDPGRALALFAEAEEVWRAAGADRRVDVAKALNNQGAALAQMGRLSEALDRFQKALALRREILPPDDPAIQSTLHNIELVHKQQADGQTAP
jgi:tetratricopeptide (TPR) repeat protein